MHKMDPEVIKDLERETKSLLEKSNASELDLIRQVILIDSGILAVIGALVTASEALNITLIQQILVTITIALLIISLASAIIHLILSHFLFLNAHKFINNLVKVIKAIETSKQVAYYNKELEEMKKTKNNVPFVLSIITLFISVLLLAVVILLQIW